MQTGNGHLLGISRTVSGGVMKDDLRFVVDVGMNAMSADAVELREPRCYMSVLYWVSLDNNTRRARDLW